MSTQSMEVGLDKRTIQVKLINLKRAMARNPIMFSRLKAESSKLKAERAFRSPDLVNRFLVFCDSLCEASH
jgi:hypothetical protein